MSPLPSPKRPRPASGDELLAFIVAYLELLLAYWECADAKSSPHDKAISRVSFRRDGICDAILHWMLFHNHVQHLRFAKNLRRPASGNHTSPKRERGTDSGSRRKNHSACQPAESLVLSDQSCFALTDNGAAFADAFLADVLLPQFEGAFESAWNQMLVGLLVPAYNRDDRVFTWGEHVLKRFRQPAENQELVLISAEELDWPEWFDDPLPRKNGHNPKTTLHDTIKDLNRRQTEWLVHFKGDGSGRRIGWELR